VLAASHLQLLPILNTTCPPLPLEVFGHTNVRANTDTFLEDKLLKTLLLALLFLPITAIPFSLPAQAVPPLNICAADCGSPPSFGWYPGWDWGGSSPGGVLPPYLPPLPQPVVQPPYAPAPTPQVPDAGVQSPGGILPPHLTPSPQPVQPPYTPTLPVPDAGTPYQPPGTILRFDVQNLIPGSSRIPSSRSGVRNRVVE
jgi:hypothetical protein